MTSMLGGREARLLRWRTAPASLRPSHLAPEPFALASWPSCGSVPPGPSLRALPSPTRQPLLSPARLCHQTVPVCSAPLPSAACLAGPPSAALWLCQTPPWGQGQSEAWADQGGDLRAYACGAPSPLYVPKFLSPQPPASAAGFTSLFPNNTHVLDLLPAIPPATVASSTGSVCRSPRHVRALRCHNLSKFIHGEFQRLETETRGHLLASGLSCSGFVGRGRGWQTPTPAPGAGNLSRVWEAEQETEEFGRAKLQG